MMNCFAMMGGHSSMMWAMVAFTSLTSVVLVLGGAALTKYLCTRGKH